MLTGNGMREPTEISPSSLFMISRCGFDSTSTSLLVCSALTSTPNDGMSSVDVAPKPRLRAWSGCSTGPSTPASMVSPSSDAGFSVFAGLKPPMTRLWLARGRTGSRQRAVERTAELAVLVERHLEDHRLDEDLLARRIEPLDHAAQRLVVLERRHDDQRVGRPIEVDAHVALEQQRRALRPARRPASAPARRAPAPPPGARPAAGRARDRDAGDRAQRLRQLVAVGVLAVVDVDAPVAALERHVELADQRQQARVGALVGDDDQLVRALVGDDLRHHHLRRQVADLGRLLAAGRAGRRRRAAARPLPPSCATWKISPSFCAISVAAVFLISTIQIFSPGAGWSSSRTMRHHARDVGDRVGDDQRALRREDDHVALLALEAPQHLRHLVDVGVLDADEARDVAPRPAACHRRAP